MKSDTPRIFLSVMTVAAFSVLAIGSTDTKSSPSSISKPAPKRTPTRPSAQVQFEDNLKLLHDEHLAASKQKNLMNERAIEGRMRAWKAGLKASPIDVADWHCSITRVNSDRELTATSGIVTYHIKLSESKAALLSRLGAGKEIALTGTASRETSLTDSGALRNPEIEVSNASIAVK